MACASLLTADERANRARGSAERANLHRHKLESGGHLSRSSTLSGEWEKWIRVGGDETPGSGCRLWKKRARHSPQTGGAARYDARNYMLPVNRRMTLMTAFVESEMKRETKPRSTPNCEPSRGRTIKIPRRINSRNAQAGQVE
jgi:hypothetical protein